MHRARVIALVLWICCAGWPLRGFAEEQPLGAPDPETVARIMPQIHKTYAADYAAARTPPQRAALAAHLLREAAQTRDNAVARYALLCEARDLASRAGEAGVACRAIELLAKHYGISPGEMTLSALSEASRSALTAAAHESLARCAMSAADHAIGRDEYDLASRCAAVAAAAAQRARKLVLIDEAQAKAAEVNWARGEHDRARSALEVLTLNPDDRDARSAAGRFRCLVKGDWERGLAMLLDGSDAAYRQLAAADLAAAQADPATQARAGDLWWDHGETLPARARACCRVRAAYWYRRCADKVAGFTRSTIARRLDQVEQERMRALHLERGLVAEIHEGESFGKLLRRRVDPQLDSEWDGAPGDEQGLPRDRFSIRWTGQLRVHAAGNHTLTLHVNEGARVFIDDKLIIDEPKGTMKQKGMQQTLMLSEGLHPIRVEFWDGGGKAKLRLLWITPAGAVEQPIPASAFYHDAADE